MAEAGFLTETEANLAEELRGLFYYPPTDLISEIKNRLLSVRSGRRPYITAAALVPLSYEQSLRRQYIAERVGAQTLNRDDQEILARAIGREALPPLEEAEQQTAQTIRAGFAAAIDNETKEQAKIFETVAKQLDLYNADVIAREKVRHIYPVLKNLPATRKAEISALISDLTKKIAQSSSTSINLPPSIDRTMTEIGLNIALEKYESLNEQLDFLNTVRTILDVQLLNDQQSAPVADDQLIMQISSWLALRNPPSVLPAEEPS